MSEARDTRQMYVGVAIAFAAAALLYHAVEEPARRWMRRMVDVKDVPPAVPTLGRDERKLSA